jgi:hypothetical protein
MIHVRMLNLDRLDFDQIIIKMFLYLGSKGSGGIFGFGGDRF